MNTYIIVLVVLLIVGALCKPKTLVHTFALSFDMFVQCLGWNDPVSVTISSRAGLAARKGKTLGAKIICAMFFNKNHCEESITADIARANEALAILTAK